MLVAHKRLSLSNEAAIILLLEARKLNQNQNLNWILLKVLHCVLSLEVVSLFPRYDGATQETSRAAKKEEKQIFAAGMA
jgi:hypothetical protein